VTDSPFYHEKLSFGLYGQSPALIVIEALLAGHRVVREAPGSPREDIQ
jgi:hypothetical protein